MLTSYFYGYVTVQIAVVDPVLLQAIRGTLYHLGCREVSYTSDLFELRKNLDEQTCDLAFVQADIATPMAVAGLLKTVRHGDIGGNPFLPLIVVTRNPSPELVRALANAGVDDILPYPWNESYLDSRLENLIHHRKPFVVTSDYIGPDRRSKPREGQTNAVPSFEAPNPLRAKALDRMSNEELKTLIRESAIKVATDKVTRLAELVVRLTGELTALHKAGQSDSSTTKVCLEKLEEATKAILRRSANTPYERSVTTCNTLSRTASVMLQSIAAHMEPELHLLQPLAERFAREFGIDLRLFAAPLTQGVIAARLAASQPK